MTEQPKKPRQTFLWEKGRPLPDLSPYERELEQHLKDKIRKREENEKWVNS